MLRADRKESLRESSRHLIKYMLGSDMRPQLEYLKKKFELFKKNRSVRLEQANDIQRTLWSVLTDYHTIGRQVVNGFDSFTYDGAWHSRWCFKCFGCGRILSPALSERHVWYSPTLSTLNCSRCHEDMLNRSVQG